MARDPTKFHHGKDAALVAALLFPESPSPERALPAQTWEDWQQPSRPISLDEEVTKLIRRTRAPAMRSQQELQGLGVSCPYYTARLYTLHAVYQASMAVEDIIRDRTQTAPRLKDMAERAARLSRDLRAFAKDHNNWTLAPLPGPYSERPDDQAINQVLGPSSAAFRDIEKAADGLDLVHTFALSRKERIAPPNRNGDVWGIAFATHLGYLWHLLTGKEPSSSSTIFIRFVEQAFISLGGERDAWESQIRTAIENVEARPEWDRFDRLEKAPDPPGTSYITLDDMKARWGRSANAWERDVREAYEQAQNGSEIALRLLALSYAKAGKKGKAFIESLGWRPSPAVRQQFDDDNA